MSYMDRKNILEEGFFDLLKKLKKRPKLSKVEKEAMKSAGYRKAVKDFDKAISDIDIELEKLRKKEKERKAKLKKK